MAKTVVLLVLDSLRYDIFYDYLRTHEDSFLSRFKESAVEFTGATAAAPWSLPSHASMFTGLYPREHGALRFNTRIATETPTLIDRLNEQGYTTACFTSNGFVRDEYGFEGWDHRPDHYGQALFADANTPTSDKSGANKIVDALGQVKQAEKPVRTFLNAVHGQARRAPAVVDDGGKAMTRDACTWIRNRSDDEDVFLFCNYMETHVLHKRLSGLMRKVWNIRDQNRLARLETKLRSKDIRPDQSLLTEGDIQLFHHLVTDELHYLDRLIARLYEVLDETDRTEDCLFILCSDHGDGLGEYGYVYHDFGGLTEPIIRVPLLVSSPGVERDTVDSRVSLSWIHSTVLDFIARDNGPVLTDTQTHPEFVGAENTGHVLDVVDSSAAVPEYYLTDRLAVYQISEPTRKYVKVGKDCVIRRIEKDALSEENGGPGGEEIIEAFETRHEAMTTEKFDLNEQTEKRLRDLGYI